MPLYHEPMFHDRQAMESMVLQQTILPTFSDLEGATITTKDLGQDGNYLSWLSLLISSSLNNTNALFRLLVDGVPKGDVSVIILKVKDLDVGYTLLSNLGNIGIPANSVLQVQYATDKGILTVSEFSLMIDGIPSTRVVSDA